MSGSKQQGQLYMSYEYHAVANIFPMMGEPEFSKFKEDIAKNGLKLPIWLHEGKIVDGRNRYKACLEIGGHVERFEEWDKKGSLVEFVVSLNTKRRHLTPSQLAIAALACLPVLEAEAKARQIASGGDKKSELAQSVNSALNEPIKATSRAESLKKIPQATQQASKIMGVGSTLISAAKAISKVSPEMIEKIQSGEITVTVATKELQESGTLKQRARKPAEIKTIETSSVVFTDAMQFASMAKSQLERIRINDINRIKALNSVIEFATKLLNLNNK